MRTRLVRVARFTAALSVAGLVLTGAATAAVNAPNQYVLTNLTSSGAPLTATHTDPHLVNPWGLVSSPTSPWWISDEVTSLGTVYPATGAPASTVVSVPTAPTGIVWNGTAGDFVVGTKAASFIFDTMSGAILGWNSGTAATNEASGASGAIFDGLAIATTASGPELFAADFHNATVDVFNSLWQRVTPPAGSFVDPNLPAGYAPFGIQTIGSNLFVTYAIPTSGGASEMKGAGLGVVDEYSTSGTLIARVATGGSLNAPWGLAQAPANFGAFGGDLLVGNFGGGQINAYTNAGGTWAFDGTLDAFGSSTPLAISGLWALEFGSGSASNGPTNTLFFTAGPAGQSEGLFGSITANPASVGATVSSQLELAISPTANLGTFVPGLAAIYTNTTTADVTSTAQTATLTVADATGLGIPGFLYNTTGGYSLASALQASGSSTGVGATGSSLAPISATPLTLVTYNAPISNDQPVITFSQAIGATDPLRTGTYTKTLTFTLSTTTP